MKCFELLLFLLTLGGTWRLVQLTCVLESDFGFTINCAFKKSGLLRVRNLGGVKAHIGLGFTLGDELGFKESISNVEINNRRRSVQSSKLQDKIIKAQHEKAGIPSGSITAADSTSQLKKKNSTIMGIPPFKPIPEINDLKKGVSTDIGESAGKISKSDFSIRTASAPSNTLGLENQLNNNNNNNNNVTEDDLDLAVIRKHQKLILSKSRKQSQSYNKIESSIGKVMNAPKEYYPVGYDKNFDDNFASRVELPETSFHCGDQKHFPGLYSDENLGCMVFHVCALTDDGLIMKSFLCPESTLFDQTILKCNWWFYVDCKMSKKLYDSNIPISKSYQLMKALTFFSTYKKESNSDNSTKIE